MSLLADASNTQVEINLIFFLVNLVPYHHVGSGSPRNSLTKEMIVI